MDGFWGNLLAGFIVWTVDFGTKLIPGAGEKIANKATQKAKQKVVQKGVQKPRASVNALIAIGNRVEAHSSQEQEGVGLGTEATALGEPPKAPAQITDGSRGPLTTYMYESLQGICSDESWAQFDKEYTKAVELLQTSAQDSASVFYAAFGVIYAEIYARGQGHRKDANALRIHVENLSEMGKNGVALEELWRVLNAVHSLLQGYFQQHRQ